MSAKCVFDINNYNKLLKCIVETDSWEKSHFIHLFRLYFRLIHTNKKKSIIVERRSIVMVIRTENFLCKCKLKPCPMKREPEKGYSGLGSSHLIAESTSYPSFGWNKRACVCSCETWAQSGHNRDSMSIKSVARNLIFSLHCYCCCIFDVEMSRIRRVQGRMKRLQNNRKRLVLKWNNLHDT